MNKAEYVLLMVLLSFSIAFLGGAEQETAFEQEAPSSAYNELHLFSARAWSTGTLNYADTWLDGVLVSESPFGENPFVRSPLLDRVPKTCWLKTAEYQRQFYSMVRSQHGTKIKIITSRKSVQQDGQPRPEIPTLFSRNLNSNSPPGLMPRL